MQNDSKFIIFTLYPLFGGRVRGSETGLMYPRLALNSGLPASSSRFFFIITYPAPNTHSSLDGYESDTPMHRMKLACTRAMGHCRALSLRLQKKEEVSRDSPPYTVPDDRD